MRMAPVNFSNSACQLAPDPARTDGWGTTEGRPTGRRVCFSSPKIRALLGAGFAGAAGSSCDPSSSLTVVSAASRRMAFCPLAFNLLRKGPMLSKERGGNPYFAQKSR